MIVRHLVATLLMWHLALGLANSKGEGGLTSSLSIVWWPRCRLQRGNLGSHHHCLASMWLVVRLVTWHCHVGRHVMVVGGGHYGWRRRRGEGGDEVGVCGRCWMMVVVEEQEKDGSMMGRIPTHGICHNPF